jgi:hypothetical protein
MATDHIRLRAFFLHQHRSANAMSSDPEADWYDAERIETERDSEALRGMRLSRPRLGVYGRNQFYIRLNLPASLIDDAGALVASPDDETLALFAHEYAHLLQNTSTVSGWDSYERHTELLRIFSNALTDEGFCDPRLLVPESIGRVQELLAEERRAEGPGSIEHRGTTTTIAVAGVTPHCDSPDCCQVTWRCADRGGNSETTVSSIGSLLIEEGKVRWESTSGESAASGVFPTSFNLTTTAKTFLVSAQAEGPWYLVHNRKDVDDDDAGDENGYGSFGDDDDDGKG